MSHYIVTRTNFFNVQPVQRLVQRPEITALLVVIFAIGGGVRFFTSPVWGISITAMLMAAVVPAVWLWWSGHRPLLLPAVAALLAAVLLSTLLHPGPVAIGRVILWLGTAALLTIAEVLPVRRGLLWAAWIFPPLWYLWPDNANITGAIAAVFVLASFSAHHKAAFLPIGVNLLLLLYTGSRGAMLGLVAGMAVYLWPFVRPKWLFVVLFPLLTVALWMIAPVTAAYRFSYWSQALAAASPFGVGPGGIWLRAIVLEPIINRPQIHAHNWAMTWFTEQGWLLGAFGLLPMAVTVPRLRLSPWQKACLIALLVHGLVDNPLWWPGPLLLAALIAAKPRYK